MENKEERFEYTYSPKRQEEIEAIRKKYLPAEDDKMTQLKKLDEKVNQPGMIWGISLGVLGVLIFGTGLSFSLVWTSSRLVAGTVLCVIGFAIMAAAYPVCKKVTDKQKEKYGPQILALTEELLQK